MKVALGFLSKLSSIAILTVFAAIGYWGHLTHWQFVTHGSEEHAQSHDEDAKPSEQPAIGQVSLSDSAGLSDTGIHVQPATTSGVREFIPAMATVTYNGHRYSQLTTRAEGHVLHVYARVGQTIKKGDVLAIIDSQVVGDAKADWLQKAVSAHYHQRTLEQLKDSNDAVIPQARIRAVEAEVREAELASFMAQQRLMNLGFVIDFKLDLERSPSELSEQVRFLGIPDELLAKLPNRPTTANLIAIQSPFEGVVVEQHAVAGEMVSTDDYQFIVADTSTMWVKLSVLREDAAKLSVGQEVEFKADGLESPVVTKLAWISPEIDSETQTIQAGCEISNSLAQDHSPISPEMLDKASGHRVFQANQFGTAKICVADRPSAILVPRTAIQRMPDQSIVAFIGNSDNPTFEKRSVRLGVQQDGLIEVVEGIKSGEMVVSEGSFILKSELMRSSLVGG